MKVRPVGAEAFHVDRQDKTNHYFSQICKCAYKYLVVEKQYL